MTALADTFDWLTAPSVVLQDQPALAVFANAFGQVVLRRQAAWDEEDDAFIHVCRENVLPVIAAMIRAAELHDVLLAQRSGSGFCDYPVWSEDLENNSDSAVRISGDGNNPAAVEPPLLAFINTNKQVPIGTEEVPQLVAAE